METKYLLVLWPESQSFIGIDECFQINPSINDENLDGAMFVPEETYNKIMNDMTINPIYNIGDEFSYRNFDHSKEFLKITAIIIREEGIYYEVEGDGWEDEFSEESLKAMYYENSN